MKLDEILNQEQGVDEELFLFGFGCSRMSRICRLSARNLLFVTASSFSKLSSIVQCVHIVSMTHGCDVQVFVHAQAMPCTPLASIKCEGNSTSQLAPASRAHHKMPITDAKTVPSGTNFDVCPRAADALKWALLMSDSNPFRILPPLDKRLLTSSEMKMRVASISGVLAKTSEALPAISATTPSS